MSYGSKLKAVKLNAWGGSMAASPLWDLSKRELIEAALHIAALCTEDFDYDAALENGAAARRILGEVKTLKRAGLV